MNVQNNIFRNTAKIPHEIKSAEFPLTMLRLKDFEGIQSGIPLFDGEKNVDLKSIAFITKRLETLNLFRGCTAGCTHCLKNAGGSVQSILFEDLLKFLSGFKNLSERFGFNVLNGTRYLNIIDDANPSDYPIKDKSGKEHGVAEAVKKIYESLRTPTLFVTSGWNPKSAYAQKASEDLVKLAVVEPESVASVEISINPFFSLMEESREALKNNNKESAEFFRNLYTSRMANTLATFIKLFESGKARIIYRHTDSSAGNELTGEIETKKLYEEIYAKLRKIIGPKIEEIKELHPDVVTAFDQSHLIEPSGRGRRYFSQSRNFKEQSQLIEEALRWSSLSHDEKFKLLEDYSVKCIDINGQVYATMPASGVDFVSTPIELTVPADIKLNYDNQIVTPKIFSDIDLEIS